MKHRSAALAALLLACGCASAPLGDQPDFVERGSGVPFELIWVPDGGFWIGRTEVTWDEFLAYCAFDQAQPELLDGITRPSKPLEVHPFDRHWGTGRRPAVGMSRAAAEEYCAWLSAKTGRSYRLPTELEWRLACGPEPEYVEDFAWYAANSGERTQEVAGLEPNAIGLFDMLGNVAEYCADDFSRRERGRALLLGGSWKDPAPAPRSRLGFEADWTLDDPGFPPGRWWVPDGDQLGFRVLCNP